jgi:cold shock CspA family protein
MRTHGTLTKWNDDRGFGFITPAKGSPDIFVHISEFPREGGRPTINELISFEVVPGPDGKQRAVRIMRPGQKSARSPATRTREQPRSDWLPRAVTLLAFVVLGSYGYSQYKQIRAQAKDELVEEPVYQASSAEDPSPKESEQLALPASSYSCDGRTMCSQMHSCEEATYFIRNCPGTKMDGNGDGEPCEQQWCN